LLKEFLPDSSTAASSTFFLSFLGPIVTAKLESLKTEKVIICNADNPNRAAVLFEKYVDTELPLSTLKAFEVTSFKIIYLQTLFHFIAWF
jgi:hypothetical protein